MGNRRHGLGQDEPSTSREIAGDSITEEVVVQEKSSSASSSDTDVLARSSSLEDCLDGPWTEIHPEDVAVQTSYVSDSMYLVLEDPSSKLMHGEAIVTKAHALGAQQSQCSDLTAAVPGTLFLTNYRLLFVAFGSHGHHFTTQDHPEFTLEVPLCNLGSIKATYGQEREAITSVLEVTTKNFLMLRFGFPYDCTTSELYQRLRKLRPSDCVAFAFAGAIPRLVPDRSGWSVYDPLAEYRRQGISPNDGGSPWRITTINSDYKLCPTYPSCFIIPAAFTDQDIQRVAAFRINGRIPVVTYLHRQTSATIARCSQPMVGLRRQRCLEDEALISAIESASSKLDSSPSSRCRKSSLHIIDCRSQTSAFANLAMGAGFESSAYYGNADVTFMGIENIHSMRDSLKRLFEVVRRGMGSGAFVPPSSLGASYGGAGAGLGGEGSSLSHSNHSSSVSNSIHQQWLSSLESTRWLEHVRSLLLATARCVELVALDGISVVCHCSDGWDRTTQLVSLSKMMLDPFYRTLRGFQVLIEQEWCSFGHRFGDRCGFSNRPAVNFWEDEECSPVFMQFLDAVWQLMQQFPCAFEFNSRFLIVLLDILYSGRSGSFFGNCERERVEAETAQKTCSVWTLLFSMKKREELLNPYFAIPGSPNAFGGTLPKVLHPDCHPANVNLWIEYYLHQRFCEAELDGKEKRALELRRKCNALAGAKATLQMQLKRTREQLMEERSEKEGLHQELQRLQIEKSKLRNALEGQMYSDGTAIVVEEEEEEDGGVLLTVTPEGDEEGSGTARRRHCVPPALLAKNDSYLRGSEAKEVRFRMLNSYFSREDDNDAALEESTVYLGREDLKLSPSITSTSNSLSPTFSPLTSPSLPIRRSVTPSASTSVKISVTGGSNKSRSRKQL